MKPSIALIIAILTATGIAADTGTKPETPKGNANGEKPRPVDLQLIKDKASVKRGEQIVVTHRVQAANIRKVVLQLPIPATLRKRRVVLQAPNKLEFKRTTGTVETLAQLRDWHVFNAPISAQEAA